MPHSPTHDHPRFTWIPLLKIHVLDLNNDGKVGRKELEAALTHAGNALADGWDDAGHAAKAVDETATEVTYQFTGHATDYKSDRNWCNCLWKTGLLAVQLVVVVNVAPFHCMGCAQGKHKTASDERKAEEEHNSKRKNVQNEENRGEHHEDHNAHNATDRDLSAKEDTKEYSLMPKKISKKGWAYELFGDVLIAADGAEHDTKYALRGKTVGVYFSAIWCGPCRGFTPQLVEVYSRLFDVQSKPSKVMFVSSCRDGTAFDTYRGAVPWLAVPFDKRHIAHSFSVPGIPALMILDANCDMITEDGRDKGVTSTWDFPWTEQ